MVITDCVLVGLGKSSSKWGFRGMYKSYVFFGMKDFANKFHKRLAAQLNEKQLRKNTLSFLQNKGFAKGFFVTSYVVPYFHCESHPGNLTF